MRNIELLNHIPFELQDNNAFLFGESCFSTMRSYEGQFPFLNFHASRTLQGIRFLYDWKGSKESFFQFFSQLSQSNLEAHKDIILRATFFRHINFDKLFCVVNTREIEVQDWKNLASPIELKLLEIPKYSQQGWPSYLKLGSYARELFDKRSANKEVIYQDEKGYLVDASTSNLFIVKNGQYKTPPKGSHVLEGIIREVLIEGLDVNTENISSQQIIEADEVFLTNSVRGIIPVKKYEEGKYIFEQKKDIFTRKALEKLIEKIEDRLDE